MFSWGLRSGGALRSLTERRSHGRYRDRPFRRNVLNVIDRVKEKIRTHIAPSLPPGVKIVATYDRSDLIRRSVATLKDEIVKLAIAVSVVCIVFLFHCRAPSLSSSPCGRHHHELILMFYLGVTSNVMSLAGIAIAIGAMVDASIIMVENAHKKLEEWGEAKRLRGDESGEKGEAWMRINQHLRI